MGSPLEYPARRRDQSVVDDYHGIKITDPYRWLEDPDSDEAKEFVEKQANLTQSLLKTCETREKLRCQLTKLFDHPRYSTPFKKGDKYFYFKNTGLQPQNVLCMQNNIDAEAEVLLDPNGLSEDGPVSLKIAVVSEDAKYLAYGLSASGSDWVSINVMRVEDKFVEPHTLSWVIFFHYCTHDNKGFFYSRYPAPNQREKLDAGTQTNSNLNQELYYHFLDPENPKFRFEAQVMDDGKHVLLNIEESSDPVNKLYYCDLSTINGMEGFKNRTDMLPFVKLFTFLTNKDAPKYKLIRVDLNEPSVWTNVIEESEKDVLESADVVNGNQILVSYLSDAKNVLQIRELQTGWLVHQLLIEIGTVYGISGRRKDGEVFIGFTSFLTLGIIYRCNLAGDAHEMKIFREIVVPGFDHAEFQVNQEFVPSKDGTKIPLFIVSKKNIILDGSHPCLLYGYGGFNSSLTPTFDTLTWFIIFIFACDFRYSPLHNVRRPWEQHQDEKQHQYPPTMLLTADHDDRVVPLHSLKLLATMQYILCTSLENSPQTNPIIARIERKAGHGCGRPTQKTMSIYMISSSESFLLDCAIDEAADQYSFMDKMLGASWIN
ncbi:hypothetical protein MKW98_021311 [Papaver atlanticum]|uniref:Prolyl oligopeptidase n=1 Tax=Papaver atlanticum TaxID=357466 RepID=A0AAD4SPS1_9MAGN|nr:hypothetical protein MKW98_021311 [Papaver atlanticum]